MQQKIQSAVSCTQPGTPVDVGEFPGVETGALPVSHFIDPTPQDEGLQPDANHCGTGGNTDKTAGSDSECRGSIAARAAIALIRVYQKTISPWLPCCCRFEPSCSHYGVDAFRKRGFLAGSILTIWRVMRCQPFCRGGYDPVPDKGFRRVTNDNQPDCKEK